jgi:hypothetical protein
MKQKWFLNGTTIPIGNVFGLSADPLKPGHVFMMNTTYPGLATDVDPGAASDAAYLGYPVSAHLRNLASARVGTATCTVSVDTASNGLYYANDTGGALTLKGPLGCPSETCSLADAVPDPSTPSGFFALCDYSPVSANLNVLRITPSSCAVAFDGSSLAQANLTPTRISLALP